MQSPLLQTRQLAIGYRQARETLILLDNLNVTLRGGELVCLIGQNGAGKSTLMRTLAGIQTPLSGEVLLMGANAHHLKGGELAKRLSIVTTERVDTDFMTGYDLVAMGRYPYTDWSGQLTAEDERVIFWALQAVGAEPLTQRRVNQMSDGERQRIMIGRALAQEPAVMLLDEPTAFLDLPRRVEMMQLLRQLAHTTQRAILLSTHDLDLALKLADVVWLMTPKQPLAIGSPEDLVLNGAYERAFQREGIQFDAQTGSFAVSRTLRGIIALDGEGLRYDWTKRALERGGYRVGDSAVRVMLTSQGWRVNEHEVANLYDLLHLLSTTLSPLPNVNFG